MNNLKIVDLYNKMADEYDEIEDLYFSWLYSRLHFIIFKYLHKKLLPPNPSCLDVGCGTGFQSVLFSTCGFDVTAIDISPSLINEAKKKNTKDYLSRDLFNGPYAFVHSYSEKTREIIKKIRRSREIKTPYYSVASALEIPFDDESFDIVNCCGNTLSLIEDYRTALNEISRVLRPGGIFILETDNKYNLDLIWAIIDSIIGGRIGYEQNIRISLLNLFSNFRKHILIDYPFSIHEDEVYLHLRLFSSKSIIKELKDQNISIEAIRAIHNFTNIIPCALLDKEEPNSFILTLFKIFKNFEELSYSLPLFRRLGNSIVLMGTKSKK